MVWMSWKLALYQGFRVIISKMSDSVMFESHLQLGKLVRTSRQLTHFKIPHYNFILHINNFFIHIYTPSNPQKTVGKLQN